MGCLSGTAQALLHSQQAAETPGNISSKWSTIEQLDGQHGEALTVLTFISGDIFLIIGLRLSSRKSLPLG